MPSNQNKVSFKDFLSKFPVIDLPVNLSEDSHHIFSQSNDPLNSVFIQEYITLMEGVIMDEYTEIVPCFAIPDTYDFYAIVYWKASLMDYQYIMATFTKDGQPISRRVIGGTYSDGNNIAHSFATIDSDWTIHIVTGHAAIGEKYDATTSTAIELELLPDGHFSEE